MDSFSSSGISSDRKQSLIMCVRSVSARVGVCVFVRIGLRPPLWGMVVLQGVGFAGTPLVLGGCCGIVPCCVHEVQCVPDVIVVCFLVVSVSMLC